LSRGRFQILHDILRVKIRRTMRLDPIDATPLAPCERSALVGGTITAQILIYAAP